MLNTYLQTELQRDWTTYLTLNLVTSKLPTPHMLLLQQKAPIRVPKGNARQIGKQARLRQGTYQVVRGFTA